MKSYSTIKKKKKNLVNFDEVDEPRAYYTQWSKSEREKTNYHIVCQSCILSPCLFNLYAEYIMRNIGLGEAQAEIKIARRNINKLR